MIPGAGHTSGGVYGDHKRYDYFVQLLGVKPPEWKELETKKTETTPAGTLTGDGRRGEN